MKVRVWHKTLNKFLPKEEWFLDFDGNLYFLSFSDKIICDYSGPLYPVIPKDAYVIQSFTGLEDEKGKEIYEGDIVLVKYKVGNLIKNRFIGHVVFGITKLSDTSEAPQHSSVCFYIKPNSNEMENVGLIPDHNYIGGHSGIEIIGNIFENPELLK